MRAQAHTKAVIFMYNGKCTIIEQPFVHDSHTLTLQWTISRRHTTLSSAFYYPYRISNGRSVFERRRLGGGAGSVEGGLAHEIDADTYYYT